jgi:O-antigen/teichoic acid export membrane protein
LEWPTLTNKYIFAQPMRKTFVLNLILMMGVNLLIKPFWILGIDRAVQNRLGFEAYGQYYILFNFVLLLSVLLDFGIGSYTTSNLAKNPDALEKQFSALLTIKILFSALYIVTTLILAYILNYDKSIWFLIFMLSFNQVLSFFHIYFRSNVSGLQLFKIDSVFSVLDRLLMIIFCSILLFTSIFELNIINFIYAQTLSYAICAVTSFLFISKKINTIKLVFDKAILWDIYKKTAPYALLALLMTLYTRLDNILIGKLIPNGEYHDGVYALGYRLLEAANMMAALVAMLLLPIFSKMIAEKQKLEPIIHSALGLLVAPSFIFGISCYFFQTEILTMLSPNANSYAVEVFGWVILCFIPLCFMYIFGTLLTANGSLKILNILALIALVTNFVLNLWLIPKYNALGAAYAALITQSFIGVSNCIYSYFALKNQFNKPIFVKLGVLFILLTILAFLLKQNTIPLFTSLGLMSLVGVFLIFVFKLLDIKQLSILTKSKFN